ncbi:60 kDa chaperonin [Striga asiatica]|uniref:60 kDa chaperonin n=1 Tax=Striga asiatica TaxID=4170 RepID=A0A5A7QAD4_STRAF|nr:60 kDa chaperonin [Striga asiatica]
MKDILEEVEKEDQPNSDWNRVGAGERRVPEVRFQNGEQNIVAPFPTNPSPVNLGIDSGFNGNFLFREKQPAFVEPRAELVRSGDGPLPAATVMQTQFPDSKPEYGVMTIPYWFADLFASHCWSLCLAQQNSMEAIKHRHPDSLSACTEGLIFMQKVEINALVFVRQKFTEALASLIVNKLRAGIKVCVVKAPGYGGYGETESLLQDRAALMGGHASTCTSIAFKIPHNFIIDQTNLYKNARRRKLKLFADFVTLAAVVFPRVEKIKFHGDKRFQEMGKATDQEGNEMSANYNLPTIKDMNIADEYFDQLIVA